jgi:hypothetical protein
LFFLPNLCRRCVAKKFLNALWHCDGEVIPRSQLLIDMEEFPIFAASELLEQVKEYAWLAKITNALKPALAEEKGFQKKRCR